MTEERLDFNQLPSDGSIECPDCHTHTTEPHPGCECRELTRSDEYPSGYHINLYHHSCKQIITTKIPIKLRCNIKDKD
jgi:hypothetical protein